MMVPGKEITTFQMNLQVLDHVTEPHQQPVGHLYGWQCEPFMSAW
jgi:hypothetical protein